MKLFYPLLFRIHLYLVKKDNIDLNFYDCIVYNDTYIIENISKDIDGTIIEYTIKNDYGRIILQNKNVKSE